MPRNGSGTYLPPQNSWNPAINGALASPDDWMAILNDMVTALTASASADGQTPITGVWNFQNNRISGVGVPIGEGDALRLQQLMKGSDVASATNIAFPIEGGFFEITGTTAITGISPAFSGRSALVRFADSLTLTNGADLALPGAANITTEPGDFAAFVCADGTAWVCSYYSRGQLSLPMYLEADIPTTDIGDIHVIGKGPYTWKTSAYGPIVDDAAQWLGTPIGGYITPFTAPPKDNPNYHYVLCTAGESGTGGYNEGVLVDETVTGTAPLVMASAKVSLAGSPMDGLTIPLINTEGRFIGAGETEAIESDSFQNITGAMTGGVSNSSVANPEASGALSVTVGTTATNEAGTNSRTIYTLGFNAANSPGARTSDHTQPRTHRLPHYRRIM